MKSRVFLRGLPWILMVALTLPMALRAEDYMEADDNRFKKEELTQMLAPIALYPDSLIAQILMASTYPLEIVEAERWLRNNSELKGEALDKALLEKDWDASVKSLCHFPDVLIAMNENLERTTRLGDAFLGQEDEVMATIQELRRRADDRGNLKSTTEQRVTDENEIIIIEPTNPEVVYIPTYDPLYAYGPWWYPDYPPYYWRYPYSYGVTGGYVGFGAPFFLGYGLFSWTWFDWHHHRIHLDFNKTHRFHRHHLGHDFDRHDRNHWRHDPAHRRGVPYGHARPGELHGSRIRSPQVHHGTPGNYFNDSNRRGSVTVPPNRTFERREGFRQTPHNNAWRPQRVPGRDHSFGRGSERRFDRGDRNPGGFNRNDNNFGRPVRNFQGYGSGHGHRNVEMGERGRGFAPHGSQIRQHGGDGRSQGRGTSFQYGGGSRGSFGGNGHFERGGGFRR